MAKDVVHDRVGLICTTQVDLGMRMVSACLREHGVAVRCFFLDSIQDHYSEALMADVVAALDGARLVGISLVEMGKARAVCITAYLRARGVQVIWGGTYPTLAADDALEHADYVCYGEGDDTMPALLRHLRGELELAQVPNLAYRDDSGAIVRNPLAPLQGARKAGAGALSSFGSLTLDDLPFPDYFTPGRHFDIDERGKLRTMRSAFPRMERSTLRFERNLWMMFGRGCHMRCSYCSVPALWDAASGLGRFFRFKSPERMIAEIEWALECSEGADYIYIMDNDFCAMPEAKLQRFCELYRERVRLPFFCYGTPVSISLSKVRALVSAGVERLDFGIQSGSDRVLEIYKRRARKQDILAAASAIATAIDEGERARAQTGYPSWKLRPYFDVIFNAPFERKHDLLETLDVIRQIGDMGFEFGLYCQPLTLFDNTGLYNQAQAGELGAIDFADEAHYAGLSYQQIAEHIIGRGHHIYLNTLIYLMRYNHTASFAGALPRRLLPLLLHPRLVDEFDDLDEHPAFRAVANTFNLVMPTRDRRYFIKRRARQWARDAWQRVNA